MEAMVGGSASYVADLEEIIDVCPDTEEASAAIDILNSINGEVKAVVEDLPPVETVNTSMFEVNNTERHYFAIIFNTDDGEVNKIKASASDFNTKFFKSSSLRVSSNLLDRQNQIVLVKTFTKVEDAMDYYTTFTGNEDELKEINEAGYTIVLISKTNYVNLFKTKEVDAYKVFFEENYK